MCGYRSRGVIEMSHRLIVDVTIIIRSINTATEYNRRNYILQSSTLLWYKYQEYISNLYMQK